MTISHIERTRRLAHMLKQVAPDYDLERLREDLQSSVSTTSTESLDVLRSSDDQKFAVESLDTLISNGTESIDRTQCESLEAIIHRRFRPALYVINDSYRKAPAPWDKILEGSARARIEQAIPAVGRIDLPNHPSLPYAGTGFVVGTNLLMTNRHVAANFVMGRGDLVYFTEGQTSVVDFKQEQGSTASAVVRIVKPLMVHPYWDMALLEVEGLPAFITPLKMSVVDTDELREETTERHVVVIGYPAQDPHNDFNEQMRIFERFEVKRLQPGVLREKKLYNSYGRKVNCVTHNCSTLVGNSGSAVIDIETGNVVGLHFAGEYLKANYAVPAFELARDARVVQAGVKFEGSAPFSDFYARIWQEIPTQRNAPESPSSRLHSVSVSTLDQSFVQPNSGTEWTIPLHVSVTLGQPRLHNHSLPAPSRDEGLLPRSKPVLNIKPSFNIRSLGETIFNWRAALGMAMASQLAYEDKQIIVERAINDWGFSDCTFIDRETTQCFVAVTDNMILISFRGTKELNDWLTNLNLISTSTAFGEVHSGFFNAFQAVAPLVSDQIESVSSRPIVLTGHSLGGAIATLAAGQWHEKYPLTSVYTFGQPAAGKDKKYKEHMQKLSGKLFRFVNDDDIVPKVPPLYSHVGTLYHFDDHGELKSRKESVSMPDDMLTETQFKALQQQLKATQDLGIGTEGLMPSVADHSIDWYIARIAGFA